MINHIFRIGISLIFGLGLFVGLQHLLLAADREQIGLDEFGYGFNVAEIDIARVDEMGFNWVKIFGPPGTRFGANVMIRIDVHASDAENIGELRQRVREIAAGNHAYIEAYEIGNEVNLDASYGWQAAPEANRYVEVLCAAYEEIKQYDPDSIVISAGLAPVGRVPDVWEGHAGHNGLYQDDREYLKEMIAAGAGACLDAVGYHNYGFSADFDTEPDTAIDWQNPPPGPENCSNGFCFRGVEKIYEIMAANGLGDKKVWTTEYGWIVDPAEVGLPECASDPSMAGRAWQFVSLEKQAENLAGSFEYAAENYPWMGGMIVFNLNFNEASYYRDCEQMRFYSVANRPAETALRELPKAYEANPGELTVSGPDEWTSIRLVSDQPLSQTVMLTLTNRGGAPVTYTLSFADDGFLSSDSERPATALGPNQTDVIPIFLSHDLQLTGIYTDLISISVEPDQTRFPLEIPMRLAVVDQIFSLFMPTVPTER